MAGRGERRLEGPGRSADDDFKIDLGGGDTWSSDGTTALTAALAMMGIGTGSGSSSKFLSKFESRGPVGSKWSVAGIEMTAPNGPSWSIVISNELKPPGL